MIDGFNFACKMFGICPEINLSFCIFSLYFLYVFTAIADIKCYFNYGWSIYDMFLVDDMIFYGFSYCHRLNLVD